MAYDPGKVKQAPPQYRPADSWGEDAAAPEYDDNNPPTWKDFIKAANRARKMLKGLKD